MALELADLVQYRAWQWLRFAGANCYEIFTLERALFNVGIAPFLRSER
jgi:hypothetical protein